MKFTSFLSRTLLAFIGAIFALSLAACGAPETPPNELEAARSVAASNAKFNATKFRADYAPDASIYSRGDSTQDKKCPQGDGWVSIDLLRNGTLVAPLKCSSYSGNIGCMIEADFKKRAQYAGEDGTCNKDVPYPLVKLAE